MSEARAHNPGANFALVQALRGIAAMWVVLFHAAEGGHVDALRAALPQGLSMALFDAGHYGVAIFFALSGFVIAHSLRDVVPSWGFLGRFALRRSIRLDPPYWASMAVVLGFAWVSARVKHEGFAWPPPESIAAHLLYLQVLLRQPPINVVYWTLTYEIQFYLFLAFMLVAARQLVVRARWRWAWPAAWVMIAALAFVAATGWFGRLPAGVFLNLWATFFAGVLGYRAPADRRAGLALAALVVVMWLAPGSDTFARISAATALLLALALWTRRIERGLDWRWLQFLGTISYSLYLLHNPLIGATGFVLRRFVGEGLTASILSLVVLVGVSVAGAWAFWRTVELTAHRWSRRVRLPRA